MFGKSEKIAIILQNICNKSILGIFLFTLLSFLICVGVYSLNYPNIFKIYEIVWFLPALLFCLFIFKLSDYFETKSTMWLITSMSLVTIIVAIALNSLYLTRPVGDYRSIWETAMLMANGDVNELVGPSQYAQIYNWQLGISAFEAFFIRLLGDCFWALKILNVVLVCVSNCLIFLLCKKHTNRNVACRAYVMVAFFGAYLLSLPQFSNHHLSLPLLLLSLILLDSDNNGKWLLGGIFVALLNLFRPYGIIVALSILMLCFYKILKTKNVKKYVVLLLMFFIPYMSFQKILDYVFMNVGYTNQPISSSSVPYFKFQKGLYGYEEPFTDLKSYGYNYKLYNQKMKEQLLDKVASQPGSIVVFVLNKMVRYLGLFDYQYEWTFNLDPKVYYDYPVRAFNFIGWFQYVIYTLLAVLGLKTFFQKKELRLWQIFFIGNTLVYVFIEAFSSYRFESYPFVILYAASSFSSFQKG